MAEPFLAEIRIFSFNFAPKGWALCNGQLLSINQFTALFSLLGTTYGGNGLVNFALPDLRARTPIHVGGGRTQGERGGEQAHTLAVNELPSHSHSLVVSDQAANTPIPANNLLARSSGNLYGSASQLVAFRNGSTTSTGGSQSHLNMQPFVTLNFCIALQGIFPSPT